MTLRDETALELAQHWISGNPLLALTKLDAIVPTLLACQVYADMYSHLKRAGIKKADIETKGKAYLQAVYGKAPTGESPLAQIKRRLDEQEAMDKARYRAFKNNAPSTEEERRKGL